MRVSECLLRAAALVETGWCQGARSVTQADGTAAYSAAGALHAVVFNGGSWLGRAPLYWAAWNRVIATDLVAVDDLRDWNDTPARSQAEVVAIFRAAATTLGAT